MQDPLAPPPGLTRLGNPANGNAPRPNGACRVLMIGDLIGKPGRAAVEELLPALRDERGIDFVTANGENVAGGMGLTPSTAESLLANGVDVITSGNHIWDKREIYPFLEANDRVLRPLNYGTHDVPGRGWGTYQAMDGTDIAVINLQGRTYMQPIENPFTDADKLFDEASEPLPPVRLVDFHCELTSEKNALGLYLDGRVSVVVGTHTHVVTGDERILPRWHGLPDRPRHDRPDLERHRLRSADRPAALHQRAADALRGRAKGRSCSTPCRSTSIRRPAGRSPWSGSSGSWTPDGGAGGHEAPRHRCRGTAPCPPGAATVDLHSHTTRSDGVLEPDVLVGAAYEAGVRTFSLTDHDTIAGYRQVVADGTVPAGMTLIPGVEINALVTRDLGLWEGELHILGFGMDPDDEAFEAAMVAQRDQRRRRFALTVDRLRDLGPADRCPGRRARSGRERCARSTDHRPGADGGGLRHDRRGRLRPTDRARRAGVRPARGPRPEGRHPDDPRRRWAARAGPLPRGARTPRASCASSSRSGSRASRSTTARSMPARSASWEMSPTGSACCPPAARTTTATLGRMRRRMPRCGSRPRSARRC